MNNRVVHSLQSLPTQAGALPVGTIPSGIDRVARAIMALEEDRLRDAQKHVESLSDSPPWEGAWQSYLGGILALCRSDLLAAQELFTQAADRARLHADGPGETEKEARRLEAAAREKAGFVLRRMDRAREALEAHRAAYALRQEFGSVDEQWETAVSLGLDHDLAGQFDDSAMWHQKAVELAERSPGRRPLHLAVARTQLAIGMGHANRWEESVASARAASEWWRRHDHAAAAVSQADLRLGHALLMQAEAKYDPDPAEVTELLAESLTVLKRAREELIAFGSACAGDVQWCDEQIDFARRMKDAIND